MVAAVTLLGCTDEPKRDEETGELAEPVEVDVSILAVGDCVADAPPEDGEEISSIEAMPCSEPHGDEVFATTTVPDGDYPGQNAVYTQAREECTAMFEDFVGLPYEESVLDISFFGPTEESWAAGSREILCTVYDPAGETTGTLRNTNR